MLPKEEAPYHERFPTHLKHYGTHYARWLEGIPFGFDFKFWTKSGRINPLWVPTMPGAVARL